MCLRYAHLLPKDAEAFELYNSFSTKRLDEVIYINVHGCTLCLIWLASLFVCTCYTISGVVFLSSVLSIKFCLT